MINADAVSNILLFLISLAGVIFGLTQFIFKRHGALYPKLVTLGFAAFAIGRLQGMLEQLVPTAHHTQFNFGFLGTVSCFLFLFTANFGVFDHLVDERSPGTARYRIIPLIAPVINAAVIIPVMFSECVVFDKIACLAVLLFAMQSSYYNLKHTIFPDVELGIADGIRGYNLSAALFSVFALGEYTAIACGPEALVIVVRAGMAACVAAAFLLLRRGVKIWTT